MIWVSTYSITLGCAKVYALLPSLGPLLNPKALDPATFTSLPACCLNEMLLGLCMAMLSSGWWVSECSCPSLHKHSPASLERKAKIAKSFFNSNQVALRSHDGISCGYILLSPCMGIRFPLFHVGGRKVLITSFGGEYYKVLPKHAKCTQNDL